MADSSFASRLPQGPKNHFVAGMGEFFGTFLFIFFALGGVNAVNTAQPKDQTILASNPSQLFYICLCFGVSLTVSVWCFFRVSGGQFNPAVTLGLVLVGAVGPIRGVINFLGQFLGALCASAVLSALFPGPLTVSTTLRDDVSKARGFFIEVFATSILVLTVLMTAVEKHRSTFMAPLAIGLALMIGELTSIPFSGGSMNPVRSFGPCAVTRTFTHYHWIYWIGPLCGGLLATAVYKLIKFFEYETANPGQDDSGEIAIWEQARQNQSFLPQHNSATDVSGQRPGLLRKLSGDTRVGDGFRAAPGLEANANQTPATAEA